LAIDEVRYRPGSYHNGSVWLFDNYQISKSLKGAGYFSLAKLIENILLDIVNSLGIFREFVRGDSESCHRINHRVVEIYDEISNEINRLEQPPQEIQAWTASAILAIKRNAMKPQNNVLMDKFEKGLLEKKSLKISRYQ
jgi:glycogen debranching enzyme